MYCERPGEAGLRFFSWRGNFLGIWTDRNDSLTDAENKARAELERLSKNKYEKFVFDDGAIEGISSIVFSLCEGKLWRANRIRKLRVSETYQWSYLKRVQNLNEMRSTIEELKRLEK